MKNENKYIGTIDRKYFIEENYTYADTPMTIKSMARHLGISYDTLESFMSYHNLWRKEKNIIKAKQLLKEGYLSNMQICDITRLRNKELEDIRKEMTNE